MQNLKDEVLVYNLTNNQAFCLNETAALIFNACDGQTSIDYLKHEYKFNDDLIHFTLVELKANNLLENYESVHFTGLTRREIVKKVGLASILVLPVISALTAPLSAQAQSAQATCMTSGNCFCQFTANTLAGTSCSINDPVYSGTCSRTGATACVSCITINDCAANNLCSGVCSAT